MNGDDVRTYDVNQSGVIIRSTYAKNAPGEPPELETLATEVRSSLPSAAMFDEASLQRSFVPDRYKAPFKTPSR